MYVCRFQSVPYLEVSLYILCRYIRTYVRTHTYMLVHTLNYAEMPKNPKAHYKNTLQYILQDYMHTYGMTLAHVCTYVYVYVYVYVCPHIRTHT